MKQRVLTAILLIVLCIPVVLMGKYAMFALALAVSMAAHYEFTSAVSVLNGTKIKTAASDIVFGTAGVIFSAFAPKLSLYAFIVGISFVFVTGILNGYSGTKTDTLMYRVWSFYIPAGVACGVNVLFYFDNGYATVLAAIVSCIICDTAAYFIGSKFGKHKLCPTISPKKTVEGSIAGLVGSVITFGMFSLLPQTGHSLPVCLCAGAVVGVFSQFGDLAASLVKRRMDIKDYGNLLPGHGGVLDRIDAILFSLLYVFIFFSLVVG